MASNETSSEQSYKLYEVARKHGIQPIIARDLSDWVLDGWLVEDFTSILSKVRGLKGGRSPLQLVDRNRSLKLGILPSWKWVKPPFEMVQEAAISQSALCVNKSGEFRILKSGFVALSHVWAEGLYADEENRGLPRTVLDQLFDKLSCIKNADWVWLDSLAVPGGARDLTVEEEKIKIALINNMGQIYGKAETVVVLDAFVVNLLSTDPIDVAVALLCGQWRTRMWTFQEARLASRVQIVTGIGSVDFNDLCEQLIKLDASNFPDVSANNIETSESTDVGESFNTATSLLGENGQDVSHLHEADNLDLNDLSSDTKFPAKNIPDLEIIITELLAILPTKNKPISLFEIRTSLYLRRAGQQIDYARALFPMLGLTWNEKYDLEKGMTKIYESRKAEAAQLPFTFGQQRLVDGPGWAPLTLIGTSYELLSNATWDSHGVKAVMCIYKIYSSRLDDSDPYNMYLQLDQDGHEYAIEISKCDQDKANERFQDVVKAGKALLLSATALDLTDAPMPRIVALVEETDNPGEVQVYFTARMYDLENLPKPREESLTLSHKSPLYSNPVADDELVDQLFNTIIDNSIPNASELHAAVRSGDIEAAKLLLANGADTTAVDSLGWTALHWSVIQPGTIGLDMTKLLLEHGTDLEAGSDSKLPLSLALEHGSEDTIRLLLSYGAQQVERRGILPLSQALYSHRSSEVIQLLCDQGADVRGRDSLGRFPLMYALSDNQNLRCLLEAGADPSARLPNGRTALHVAAINDYPESIQTLVDFDVPVDILEKKTNFTPLYYAVINKNLQSVKTLLSLYANTERPFQNGWTVLMYAIETGHMEIVESLLEAGSRLDVASRDNGSTPLHMAISNGDILILNLLLEQPASDLVVWRKDANGRTPTSLAKEFDDDDMETLLDRRRSNNDSPMPTWWVDVCMSVCLSALVVLALPWSTLQPSSPSDSTSNQSTGWPTFRPEYIPSLTPGLIIIYALLGYIVEKRRTDLPKIKDKATYRWRNRRRTLEESVFKTGILVILGLIPWYLFELIKRWTGPAVSMFGILVLLTSIWTFYLLKRVQKIPKHPNMVHYYLKIVAMILAVAPVWTFGLAYTDWITFCSSYDILGTTLVSELVSRYAKAYGRSAIALEKEWQNSSPIYDLVSIWTLPILSGILPAMLWVWNWPFLIMFVLNGLLAGFTVFTILRTFPSLKDTTSRRFRGLALIWSTLFGIQVLFGWSISAYIWIAAGSINYVAYAWGHRIWPGIDKSNP